MVPPLQAMPPAFWTITGVVPSSVPEEIVNVPGCQGPVPLKFAAPPETLTALPLTVVAPFKMAVPELNVQVPPRFNATPTVTVEPPTVKLPAPERVPALTENVPPPKSNVAPDTAANDPLLVPPPLKSSVPPLIAT